MNKTLCPFLFETEVDILTNPDAVEIGSEPEHAWMPSMIDWRDVRMVRAATSLPDAEDVAIITFKGTDDEIVVRTHYRKAFDAWLRAQFTDMGIG